MSIHVLTLIPESLQQLHASTPRVKISSLAKMFAFLLALRKNIMLKYQVQEHIKKDPNFKDINDHFFLFYAYYCLRCLYYWRLEIVNARREKTKQFRW